MIKDLTIIIPCYNEYNRLPLNAFKDFIAANEHYFFCFVNDGSTDQTLEMLNRLLENSGSNIHVLNLINNGGKANAVRSGVNYVLKNSLSKHIAFLDADLSTPLAEVKRVFQIMTDQELLFAFGSRVNIFGHDINRSSFRHYSGRILANLTYLIHRLPIYDTQCGMKIFSGDLAEMVFKEDFISKWLFDIEIFVRLRLLYSNSELRAVMKELPLENWVEKGNSKISLYDILTLPLILVKIALRYRNTKTRQHFDEVKLVLKIKSTAQ